MTAEEFAPAKINLFLHVGPPRADGRHPVCSLAVFADVGDRIEAEAADAYSLTVDGPFAADAGPPERNLVTRALEAAGAPPMAVRLTKALPAAAGLGGGSSDAGAALRLAGRLYPDIEVVRLDRAARSVGADGPLCFAARPCLAEGQGDELSEPPGFPDLHAVLINPGVASATAAVYAAYDRGSMASADRPAMPSRFEDLTTFVAFLEGCRNDLEAPAVGLAPEIGDVLAWLKGRPEALLGRMSGSGATCFAICEDPSAAQTLAAAALAERPDWWVRATCLGGASNQG